MTTDIVVSFPVVFTTYLLLTGSNIPFMDIVHVRGDTQAGRTSKTISDSAFRWWREVLSASCYEGHGSRGKAHKKIYQLHEVYTIFW